MNVNKAIVVGRLTRDPEIRTTPSGTSVTNIGVATSRNWKDQSGQKQEQTEYHNIVLWNRLAEIAGQYLTKGQEVYIEGRLQTRSFTGSDNVERKTTEIVAEQMQMGSRPQGQGSGNANQGNQFTQGQNTSAGAAPAAAAGGGAVAGATAADTASKKPEPMDEIPTINLDDEKEEVKIEDVPF